MEKKRSWMFSNSRLWVDFVDIYNVTNFSTFEKLLEFDFGKKKFGILCTST